MPEKRPSHRRFAWQLWIPVILAFLLLAAAWGTLIWIAGEHPTERIDVQVSDP